MPDTNPLVTQLLAAHEDTATYTGMLADARQRRREFAAQLHDQGYTYAQIGAELGVTAQAVEGFLKYHKRRRTL